MMARFAALVPLLLLEPIAHEFRSGWHHSREYLPEMRVSDEDLRVHWRPERAGGSFVQFRSLWTAIQTPPLSALFGGTRLDDVRLRMMSTRLPPETTIDVRSVSGGCDLIVRNPVVTVRVGISVISIGCTDARFVSSQISLDTVVTYSRRAKFRTDFSGYAVWARRMRRAIEGYTRLGANNGDREGAS
jgi:hypothetical protein